MITLTASADDGSSLSPEQIWQLQKALRTLEKDPAWNDKIIVLPLGSYREELPPTPPEEEELP